jgi:hypothetical protein
MSKPNGVQTDLLDEVEPDQELEEQKAILKAFSGTLHHFLEVGKNYSRGQEIGASPNGSSTIWKGC